MTTHAFLADFMPSLLEFDKAALSYYFHANQLANYLTEGLLPPISWRVEFEKDLKKFPGKQDLNGFFFSPIFVHADKLERQYPLSNNYQSKDIQKIESLVNNDKLSRNFFTRLTDSDARGMMLDQLDLYSRVNSITRTLQRHLDNLVYGCSPSSPLGFDTANIKRIILLLNISQFGSAEKSLKKRLSLIRKTNLGGLGTIIINDRLTSLQKQCKTIKNSALDMYSSILFGQALSEYPQSKSKIKELNMLNEDPSLKNGDRIFLYCSSFEDDFKKLNGRLRSLYSNTIKRLKFLKTLPVLELITGKAKGRSGRPHCLSNKNVCKIDVLKTKWQMSFRIDGEKFIFLRIADHDTMDRLYK